MISLESRADNPDKVGRKEGGDPRREGLTVGTSVSGEVKDFDVLE
jgi:hypothetical protein